MEQLDIKMSGQRSDVIQGDQKQLSDFHKNEQEEVKEASLHSCI